MKTVAIVVIVLVVLLVIVLAVLAGRRNKRRAALRERFGPEYDLAVKRGKDRRAVEQRLEQLAQQRDRLDIRDVPAQEHVRFAQEWDAAQGRFVDDPGQAVADADGLLNSVLRSRGYPVDSFDDRAALVATDHQDVVEGYRSAHDTFAAHLQGGSTDTESLRKAFLQYREVFGRLNVPDGEVRRTRRATSLRSGPRPCAARSRPHRPRRSTAGGDRAGGDEPGPGRWRTSRRRTSRANEPATSEPATPAAGERAGDERAAGDEPATNEAGSDRDDGR